MSNTMRWRYGETNPVMLPAQAGDTIEIGDLVYLDGGFLRPATSQADQGSLASNQELFHDNFVGVAMQCSSGASDETLRIATSGVFEFDCAPSNFSVGDLIGTTEDGVGNQLQPQTVESVGAENLAVGRCVKQTPVGSIKVLVDVVSTVVRGGAQAAA